MNLQVVSNTPVEAVQKVPRHVALIMDGNRRWARARGLSEVEGHRQGVRVIKPLIKYAFEQGVEAITFWAFSTKNFRRDHGFLKDIFEVFRETLDNREWFDEIKQAGGEVRIIGDPEKFPLDIRKRIAKYLSEQEDVARKGVVNFGLGYEGRDEILRAVKKMAAQEPYINGNLNEELFGGYLDTAGLPDPDLLIRTGGEQRLSGFMLWQIADAELYFPKTLWPDFTVEEFKKALREFEGRERRFGK